MQPETGQTAFAGALLAPNRPLPAGIVDPDGKPAPKRFAVYRNNVTVSLIGALADAYPAIRALVGEGFFDEMARRFVRAHPPLSPVMTGFGTGFAEFIRNFGPAAQLRFLPDVAALERLWLEVFHAADATPVGPGDLAGLDPTALETLRLAPHPAARLLRSEFAVVDIWRAAKAGTPPQGDVARPQSALVVRPGFEVDVFPLSDAGSRLVGLLWGGQSLGRAAELASTGNPDFDAPAALTKLLGAGVFVAAPASQVEE